MSVDVNYIMCIKTAFELSIFNIIWGFPPDTEEDIPVRVNVHTICYILYISCFILQPAASAWGQHYGCSYVKVDTGVSLDFRSKTPVSISINSVHISRNWDHRTDLFLLWLFWLPISNGIVYHLIFLGILFNLRHQSRWNLEVDAYNQGFLGITYLI